MGVSRTRMSLEASTIFLAFIVGFLPPFLPRALAASRHAMVLSRIRSHSNSPTAPKTWKTSFPPGVGGVYALPQEDEIHPTLAQGAPEAVQLPHDELDALAAVVHRRPQLRSVLLAGRDLLLEDPLAPERQEVPTLDLGVLVLLGHPDVGDLHAGILS
jgi:hypothetical protein